MSDNDDLIKALTELMYSGKESDVQKPLDEPISEDFQERLAECERIVNS
jgi:hypothetical protein